MKESAGIGKSLIGGGLMSLVRRIIKSNKCTYRTMINSGVFMALILAALTVSPAFAGYSFFRTVTVDKTKVPNTDQTNFAVLVKGTYAYLATVPNGGKAQNASGFDIGFFTTTGCATKLDWETDYYTDTTGDVAYWVRIPTLTTATDFVFYMCYDDATISTDQSNPNVTWNSNYVGVYHLRDGVTLSGTGSTTTPLSLTNNSGTATAGQINGAAALNGTSGYLSNSTLGVSATPLTITGWVNASAGGGVVFSITKCSGGSGAFDGFYMEYELGTTFSATTASNTTFTKSSKTGSSGALHHVAAVFASATSRTIYVDGVAGTTDTTSKTPAATPDCWNAGAFNLTGSVIAFFSGSLDEMRVNQSALSADWITTEFNNQSSPSTFYAIGAETPVAAGSGVRRRVIIQ